MPVSNDNGGFKVVHTCERCWNSHDNLAEAIMAKKKAAKKAAKKKASKGKKPEIRPCVHCGRVDFGTDQARRAHQGRCPLKEKSEVLGKKKAKKASKPPKPIKKKAAKKKAPAKKKAAKTSSPPPPVEGGKRSPRAAGRMAKAKGNKFENDVKKLFAAWWGEPPEIVGSKESAFQRAPGSGGTSPVNWPLDLHVPEDFLWAVECKNREGVQHGMESMERFLTAGTYQVVQWFVEAERELVKVGIKKPVLLVFTRNQYPIFAAIRRPGRGEDMFLPMFRSMTLVDPTRELELLVMKFEDMLNMTRDDWENVYVTTVPRSYVPRG